MSEITVEVNPRTVKGKNASRRLRAAGILPAVVYGGGKDPVNIEVDRRTIHDLVGKEGGANAVFLLKLAGTDKARHTMVRDISVDPISRQIIHIDFQRVLMTDVVKVEVAIELEGIPEGVKNQDGVLDFIMREVTVECLPGNIPTILHLDVSALEVGEHLLVGDLTIPEEVELVDEPTKVIVAVSHSKVAAEVEAAEEEEEGVTLIEAGEEEPEVIGKTKDEEDEDS